MEYATEHREVLDGGAWEAEGTSEDVAHVRPVVLQFHESLGGEEDTKSQVSMKAAPTYSSSVFCASMTRLDFAGPQHHFRPIVKELSEQPQVQSGRGAPKNADDPRSE